ncbi:MAG: hypothetical protein Q9225_001243 [Loekoesia sp. 1 TL-2023]
MVTALPPEQRKPVSLSLRTLAAIVILICAKIREKAEAEFFALLSRTSGPPWSIFMKHIECLLSVIGGTDKDVHSAASATRKLVQIYEKLVELVPAPFTSGLGPERKTGASATIEFEESLTFMKLDALLRLLHIHQSAFQTPNVSDSAVSQLLHDQRFLAPIGYGYSARRESVATGLSDTEMGDYGGCDTTDDRKRHKYQSKPFRGQESGAINPNLQSSLHIPNLTSSRLYDLTTLYAMTS